MGSPSRRTAGMPAGALKRVRGPDASDDAVEWGWGRQEGNPDSRGLGLVCVVCMCELMLCWAREIKSLQPGAAEPEAEAESLTLEFFP